MYTKEKTYKNDYGPVLLDLDGDDVVGDGCGVCVHVTDVE